MKHDLIEKTHPKINEHLTELVELGEIMRVLADEDYYSDRERKFFANVADVLDKTVSDFDRLFSEICGPPRDWKGFLERLKAD